MMSREEKLEILSGVPLFAGLRPAERERLADVFGERTLQRGDILCREGEAGDSLYVIARGELEIESEASPGRVLRRLGPGEFVGEIALLLGGPRTATVQAGRPSLLLALTKKDFQELFGGNAAALEAVSRILARRLATAEIARHVEKENLVVSVHGRRGVPGVSLVANALAALLQEFTHSGALLVELRPAGRRSELPDLRELAKAPPDTIRTGAKPTLAGYHHLSLALPSGLEQKELAGCLDAIAWKSQETFPCIVVDLPAAVACRSAPLFSDVVIRVSNRIEERQKPADGRTRRFEVLNLYAESAPSLPISHCEPFVLRADAGLAELDGPGQARHLLDHPRSPASPALRRLARKILGNCVGIALGGGAAFGIAHVGVFQVLEEHGIPVDLVAGTSMGSMVALGYAGGIEPREMREIAGRIGNKRTTLSALDFTLTKPGLLAGDRLVSIFAPLLGPVQDFEQLLFPCRTVATDIESGERISITEGKAADAFRASCSVPLLWSPVRRDGRVLVDGGMVDPVPAEVAREMGADVCIAVNVVPQLERGVETVLSRWYRRANALNPLSYLGESRGMPSTFDTIMNAIQVLQYELGNFKAISADVRINPDLAGFTWIEFYRPLELIERGAVATERAIPEIKRVLAERAPAWGRV